MTLNEIDNLFKNKDYECVIVEWQSPRFEINFHNYKLQNNAVYFYCTINSNKITLYCEWPVLSDTQDLICCPHDKKIGYNIENLTEEFVNKKIENVEKQLIFLNEYLKKQKMYKRKQTLNKDF